MCRESDKKGFIARSCVVDSSALNVPMGFSLPFEIRPKLGGFDCDIIGAGAMARINQARVRSRASFAFKRPKLGHDYRYRRVLVAER